MAVKNSVNSKAHVNYFEVEYQLVIAYIHLITFEQYAKVGCPNSLSCEPHQSQCSAILSSLSNSDISLLPRSLSPTHRTFQELHCWPISIIFLPLWQ